MGKYKIAVLIPAFNEEASISSVVSGVIDSVESVYVVNDFSTDKTVGKAVASGAKIIDNSINLGYSKSIERGLSCLAKESYDYVVTMDADGQHTPESLGDMVRLIECESPDLVVGNRQEYARVAERVFACYFKFKYKIKDPLCGLKAYRARSLAGGGVESFDSIGTSVMCRMLRAECDTAQLDIKVAPRHDKPRLGGVFRSNVLILNALLHLMLNEG